MRRGSLLFCLVWILAIPLIGQSKFEKGFYIDNAGNRITGLIKNRDWANNPTSFRFKSNDKSEEIVIELESAQEFGVDNKIKFIRKTIDIDVSSDALKDLTSSKNPEFEKRTLWLRTVVEGKANLYQFASGSFNRFFFNTDDSRIEQLIYKKFKASSTGFLENNGFKSQIQNSLKCEFIDFEKINSLKYRKKELVKIFNEYNSCQNSQGIDYTSKRSTKKPTFYIKVGGNLGSMNVDRPSDRLSVEFGSTVGFRVSLASEFYLSFNNNQWSIPFEPTFSYYQASQEIFTLPVQADYNHFEFPIGLRRYISINENAQLFVNSFMVIAFPVSSQLDYTGDFDLEISSGFNFAVGAGYLFKEKFLVEARYDIQREITPQLNSISTKYNNLSLVFGITL